MISNTVLFHFKLPIDVLKSIDIYADDNTHCRFEYALYDDDMNPLPCIDEDDIDFSDIYMLNDNHEFVLSWPSWVNPKWRNRLY